MARPKGEIVAQQWADENPQLDLKYGKKHIKLMVNGRLVGILPRVLHRDGVSANLCSQLRRAGLTI